MFECDECLRGGVRLLSALLIEVKHPSFRFGQSDMGSIIIDKMSADELAMHMRAFKKRCSFFDEADAGRARNDIHSDP